jgi:chromosome segregation ATPase
MQAVTTLKGANRPMPTFTPGWNFGTFLALLIAGIGGTLGIVGVFITSRYSLLSKILESMGADKKIAVEEKQRAVERFDNLDHAMRIVQDDFQEKVREIEGNWAAKFRDVEKDLHASRSENLQTQKEILNVRAENAALRDENAALRQAMQHRDEEMEKVKAENRRLSGECEAMRRKMELLHPAGDTIE